MVFLCWGWYLFGHRDGVGGGTFVLVCTIEGPFYFCYGLEKMIDNIWLFYFFQYILVWFGLVCVTMNEWMIIEVKSSPSSSAEANDFLVDLSIELIVVVKWNRNACWLWLSLFLCFFLLCRTLFIRFCCMYVCFPRFCWSFVVFVVVVNFCEPKIENEGKRVGNMTQKLQP